MIRLLMLAASIVVIYTSSRAIEALPPSQNDKTSYGINTFIAESMHAGYGTFLSSLLWIDVIFAFANELFEGERSLDLPRKIDLVTSLDPVWGYPYHFAGLILPCCSDSLNGVYFLRKGLLRFPRDWKMRIYLALAMKEHGGQLNSVVDVLMPLTKQNSIPDYARLLVFSILNDDSSPKKAVESLVQVYEQVPDQLVRTKYIRKIGEIICKNNISLGADSADYFEGVASMLNSDSESVAIAKLTLFHLVSGETRQSAILGAKKVANDYRIFQMQSKLK